MTKETKIAAYLQEKYSPEFILIHGSRAIGKERLHSDWDIFLFFLKTPLLKKQRENIEGEDVEWGAYTLPIKTEDIKETFGAHLQYARVLWERESMGTDLLMRSKKLYELGPQLSKDDRRRRRQFIEHKLAGMKDDEQTPYLFLRHLSVFFERSTNYFFEVLHNEYSRPFYLALPDIQIRDAVFYNLLIQLCGDGVPHKKIAAGEQIIHRLFQK